MATQQVIGSPTLSIGPGQTEVVSVYTATKLPASWSVTVLSDGALSPGDYTVSIGPTGVLTLTLLPGADIPPGGVTVSLAVTAVHAGGGQGNTDTLTVSIAIDENAVPCFVEGTLITTTDGERPIETLGVGDRVLTLDGGAAPIRHILRREIGARRLASESTLRPVRIKAGAFGAGRPHTDLLVSPFHRILIGGWDIELHFGAEEAFAHAVHLVNDHSVVREDTAGPVTYIHLIFDRHEIILSNGLASESLHLGNVAVRCLDREDVAELERLFPEAESLSEHADFGLARGCLTRSEATLVASMR
ncbi:Hint domain-containing protein [Defluviimonas sp. WL0024]|uniref:Hint domain-containing protein n=1 Tax=Albidovulum salinarum TaxID=2984153 RepID=A0ABT2X3W9_9RHOB|nr:Hint domain-containing protein [Defluviimonas sp. WL0024]MCU9848638.1 Hint domain-containing protein [Defluviimonas sp. WL0024]